MSESYEKKYNKISNLSFFLNYLMYYKVAWAYILYRVLIYLKSIYDAVCGRFNLFKLYLVHLIVNNKESKIQHKSSLR